ncbi:histone [candidate division MSBL1 archaeon SCGC-AAA259J03]|uniref:Histone n=2 Tax=candidate division MSBL1 TaxID=215777 RepID=A0A656YWD1_9EURY|nr:histone [candidate division MSBL1 archaeon SCGC-AAA259E22]KXA97366.1 histone [candidate division MSBL1 archaeon SCGC-AAA259J03]
MGELPVAAVDRIIRRAGGQRVSEGAAVELAEVLEEKGLEIAKEAAKLSEHAGRKTVRDTDVRLALERK